MLKKKQQKLQIVAKGKFIENEVPRETSLCQQTWKCFPGAPREKKKDYVMDS